MMTTAGSEHDAHHPLLQHQPPQRFLSLHERRQKNLLKRVKLQSKRMRAHWTKIAAFLDLQNTVAFALTCRRLQRVLRDDQVWWVDVRSTVYAHAYAMHVRSACLFVFCHMTVLFVYLSSAQAAELLDCSQPAAESTAARPGHARRSTDECKAEPAATGTNCMTAL